MKFQRKFFISDYIGKTINYLTPLKEAEETAPDGSQQWVFKCICGKQITEKPDRVISGHKKSCGCMRYVGIKHKEHRRDNLQRVIPDMFIGKKQNMLTVLSVERPKGKGRTKLKCVCDCGNITYVLPYQFKNGEIKSCGCLRNKDKITHGLSKNPLYSEWYSMIRRCYNPKADNYERYGGRGITVCEEWLHSPAMFFAWVESIGGKPEGFTLDRIDNNGPYAPDNCRFADNRTQSRNKRSNTMISANGKTQCVSDWSKESGIPVNTIQGRLARGWNIEQAVTQPVKKSCRNGRAKHHPNE